MSKLLPIVNIGTKSGSFKYILAQLGKKYLIRGDPTVDRHGKTRVDFQKFLYP
jgi:hypothetical protein